MGKKIVPTMRYEQDTGGLKLDMGARTFGVFEGYDDLGQPFSLDGLADHIGPMIVEAFWCSSRHTMITLNTPDACEEDEMPYYPGATLGGEGHFPQPWTREADGCWLSPCKRYLAQRENTVRWSLWKLRDGRQPGKRTAYELVGEHYRTLTSARETADELSREAFRASLRPD